MCNLYVDSLTKSFGNKQLLTDVYLTCRRGEIVGLLGRNGVGKSTLLQIIFGLSSADSKFVKVGDKRLENLFDSKYLIGYLPDKHFLPNNVKIATLINIICDEKNQKRLKVNTLINSCLNKYHNQLSGGERRIIEIFLILYSKNKFILLDEPFKGIDPLHKNEITSIIKELSKEKGIIITDHDYRTVLEISNKILLLKDGGLRHISNPGELNIYGFYI